MSEILSTIKETFELPSKGLIYDRPINPQIKLRSMTTQDEMARLSPSEDKCRTLAELIENCIEGDKPDLSVYDMCMGDYYYLLNALRVVTYGSDYHMMAYCLACQTSFETTINLDELRVLEWDDSIKQRMFVTLPTSGKLIELNYQTPRIIDDIARRVKQMKKQNKDLVEENEELLQKVIFSIKTIDGRKPNPAEVETLVRKMKMADFNVLSQKIDALNEALGPVKVLALECTNCHNTTLSLFRYSPEFFRPTVD